MEPKNLRVWLTRFLFVVFFMGTIAAAALWIAATTAKCEGFGCLGVGVMGAMAFLIHITSASVGGLLLWRQRQGGRLSLWLMILETLHVLPIMWFLARMAWK